MATQDHPALSPSGDSKPPNEAYENGAADNATEAVEPSSDLREGFVSDAPPADLPDGSNSVTLLPDLPEERVDFSEAHNQVGQDAMGSETAVEDTSAVEAEVILDVPVPNGNNAVQKESIENEPNPKSELQGADTAPTTDQVDDLKVIHDTTTERTREANVQGDLLPSEVDSIKVPKHWHFKPSVHVTIHGGEVKEEEMVTLFGAYGPISSISFESERRDSAIIRYDYSASDADKLVVQVREALNNIKVGNRTLIVDYFRSDSLLFVGNLTPDIDDAILLKMFEPHGRVERAFVLRNAEGHSKGYGFVEYSLKGQASTAKMTMGNINMDGRVLRVEWSECRKVADMFSTVLFIDRISRDNPHVEQSLRSLFGQYGKVKDCYLAVGAHQQFRGFAFIEFTHSIYADRAHHVLDGHELDGSTIRVSFGNPSKSVQSYKIRSGPGLSQFGPGHFKKGASDHSSQPSGSGMHMGGPLKGSMGMPYLASRYMPPVRPGMVGMGIGMQFGRGPLERGLVPSMLGSGAGMLGPGSVAAGMMGRAPLMVGNMSSRPYMGTFQLGSAGFQGPQASTSSTGVTQVTNTQAKAREEEARARAEALKQGIEKAASQQQANHYRLNASQQILYQQQITASTDQNQKQTDSISPYHQAYQKTSQQTSLQAQYQGWAQQQAYDMQYYSQPTQNYSQAQQTSQQQDGYYQQSMQQVQPPTSQQQYPYAQQYSTQYAKQYSDQQNSQSYNQAYSQVAYSTEQQYQQPSQQQPQTSYQQPQAAYQQYVDQYSVQTTQDQAQMPGSASEGSASVALPVTQDLSQQQQAYAAYYQQQAQIQAGTAATTSSTANQQQSYEAQWAAYYASQAAYQQQATYSQQQAYAGAAATTSVYAQGPTTDATGQKRTAEQMESASQTQVTYNYAQLVPTASGYTQQAVPGTVTYQQQPAASTPADQKQPVAMVPNYQQPSLAQSYQQQTLAASGYQLAATTNLTGGYDQTGNSVTDSYQQQQSAAATGSYQTAIPGQTTVASMYDYSKRPKY